MMTQNPAFNDLRTQDPNPYPPRHRYDVTATTGEGMDLAYGVELTPQKAAHMWNAWVTGTPYGPAGLTITSMKRETP